MRDCQNFRLSTTAFKATDDLRPRSRLHCSGSGEFSSPGTRGALAPLHWCKTAAKRQDAKQAKHFEAALLGDGPCGQWSH